MSKKYTLLTFKDICMNFLLELKFLILCHPVTSKQPREIVQIHMHHPVTVNFVNQKLKKHPHFPHNLCKLSKAKFSRFDRTRGDKNQIFRTYLAPQF